MSKEILLYVKNDVQFIQNNIPVMKQLHTDSQTNPQQALRLQKGYLHQYTGSEAPPFPISFSGEDVLDAAKKIIKKGIYGTFRTQAHLL
ncbi:hypothetical protein KC866_04130, partial [Patescibacteria group bacterium]|nr:hypothetical protein [Patescibacteria group bacterium]